MNVGGPVWRSRIAADHADVAMFYAEIVAVTVRQQAKHWIVTKPSANQHFFYNTSYRNIHLRQLLKSHPTAAIAIKFK